MTIWTPMKWWYSEQYEGPRTGLVKRILNVEEESQLRLDF